MLWYYGFWVEMEITRGCISVYYGLLGGKRLIKAILFHQPVYLTFA